MAIQVMNPPTVLKFTSQLNTVLAVLLTLMNANNVNAD